MYCIISINQKILNTLYYSLIYPHLFYDIELWGSADFTHLNHSITFQKRFIRMTTYLGKRQPLFVRPGFLKVQDLFKLKIAKFIYNCINKHNPTNFHLWFKLTTQTHNRNTRSKFIYIDNSRTTNNLFIPTARTTHCGLKSLKVQGPKMLLLLLYY